MPPTLDVAYAKTSRCKMLETNNVSKTGKEVSEAAGGGAGGMHVGENKIETKQMRARHFAIGTLGGMKE